MDDRDVVCWPEYPLASGEPGSMLVALGIRGQTQLLSNLFLTLKAGIRPHPPAPGQTFDHNGTRVYWPSQADAERVAKLCRGAGLDAVPWGSLHAELQAATPNYIADRDWSKATGAAILLVVEELREGRKSEALLREPLIESGMATGDPSNLGWKDTRALAALAEFEEARHQLEQQGDKPTRQKCHQWLTLHGRIESCPGAGFDTWKKAVQRGQRMRPSEGLEDAVQRGHSVVRASQIGG